MWAFIAEQERPGLRDDVLIKWPTFCSDSCAKVAMRRPRCFFDISINGIASKLTSNIVCYKYIVIVASARIQILAPPSCI